MPFVSAEQKRACLYKWIEDIKNGIDPPKWDCVKYAKIEYAGRLRTIHKGSRGGYYVNVNGKKRYLKINYA